MKSTKHINFIHFYLTIFFLSFFFPNNNLYCDDISSSTIILSSYSISGNAQTDDFITLHLVLSNRSKNFNIYNALFTYNIVSENSTFFPFYGNSNQFILPVIPANSDINYDLKISVQNAIPNDILNMDFSFAYTDDKNNTNTGKFYIFYVFKDTEAVQLLGIQTVNVQKLSDNYKIVSFRANVINHSNFFVQNVTMDLEGKNFKFSTTIPLNNINPGEYITRYFNLNIISDDIPQFIIKFHYNDSEGFSYDSNPQTFNIYLNYNTIQNTGFNITHFFLQALFILFILLLIAGSIILLIKLQHKKEV